MKFPSPIVRHGRTVLTLACLAVAASSVRACQAERDARILAEANVEKQRTLATGAEAKLAATEQQRKDLAVLLASAKELNGKLLAGVKITVEKRDTLIIHDTIPTTVSVDSTRIATFRDSTFAGVVSGTVTAPPCCTPLSLSYRVDRPAFSPSVGFVQVGSGVVAVVAWQGEQFQVTAPFADLPTPQPRLTRYVRGSLDQTLTGTVEVGVSVRTWWGLHPYAAASQRLEYGEPTALGVGLMKTF